MDQVFRPYDNSGVVHVGISDFSCIAVVKTKESSLFQQLCHSYVMTVFLKETMKFCWMIQTVVTKNLGPFLNVYMQALQKENYNPILTLYAFSFAYIRE